MPDYLRVMCAIYVFVTVETIYILFAFSPLSQVVSYGLLITCIGGGLTIGDLYAVQGTEVEHKRQLSWALLTIFISIQQSLVMSTLPLVFRGYLS